jgi:hypothetical protein
VDFKLSPGIRGSTKAGFRCVDEGTCDEEAYFLCAQKVHGSVAVDYLACADGSSEKDPTAKAKQCASAGSLPWASISSCFSGKEGPALEEAAAEYFNKRFPAPVGVPHIEINGKAQEDRSYASLLKVLCATGIKASGCSSTSDTLVI